jgi:hypothetical protein
LFYKSGIYAIENVDFPSNYSKEVRLYGIVPDFTFTTNLILKNEKELVPNGLKLQKIR